MLVSRLFCSVLSLVLLSGCFPKKKKQISSAENSALICCTHPKKQEKKTLPCSEVEHNRKAKHSSKQELSQLEARFDDIPTPLLSKLIRTQATDSGCYELLYETDLSFVDLKAFYDTELKAQGWDTEVQFAQADECLFACKKMRRSCILALAPEQSSWITRQPATIRLLVQC